MARILIAYTTKEGHTRAIADRMRERLEARGHVADVVEVDARSKAPPDIDAALVGGSIHAGKHQPELVDFVRRSLGALKPVPSAFFAVCLTAAYPDPDAAAESRRYVDEFLRETGWRPGRTAVFAGALAWTQYDFFTRVLMKLIAGREGVADRDTSMDYDYTDHDAVCRFADELAEEAESVLAATTPTAAAR